MLRNGWRSSSSIWLDPFTHSCQQRLPQLLGEIWREEEEEEEGGGRERGNRKQEPRRCHTHIHTGMPIKPSMIWANEEHSPSPKQETRRPDFPRFLRRERERERERKRGRERHTVA